MATGLTCLVCGGTYTADQRRRHEQTTKHVNAQIGRAMKGQAEAKKESTVRSPLDTRPAPDPAKVEAHVAALKANGESGLGTESLASLLPTVGKAITPQQRTDRTGPRVRKVSEIVAKVSGKAKPGATTADLVVTGDPVEFWTRRVKIWANDVKWADDPANALADKTANAARLAARKQRLANAKAFLAEAQAAANE